MQIDGLSDSQNENNKYTKDISVIYFYAPWCHYCTNFNPEWEKLIRKYPNGNFKKYDIDRSETAAVIKDLYNKKVFSDASTSIGVPTIIIKKEEYVEYKGPRNTDAIEQYLNKNSAVQSGGFVDDFLDGIDNEYSYPDNSIRTEYYKKKYIKYKNKYYTYKNKTLDL